MFVDVVGQCVPGGLANSRLVPLREGTAGDELRWSGVVGARDRLS